MILAPLVINKKVPAKPMTTPIICLREENILKAKKPNMIVFIGTIEFNIEAIALSISVSAYAKRKAGKKVPNNPEMAIHFKEVLDNFLKLLKPAENNIKPVIMIRKEPNCKGVKPTNPFLININELPQINARINK